MIIWDVWECDNALARIISQGEFVLEHNIEAAIRIIREVELDYSKYILDKMPCIRGNIAFGCDHFSLEKVVEKKAGKKRNSRTTTKEVVGRVLEDGNIFSVYMQEALREERVERLGKGGMDLVRSGKTRLLTGNIIPIINDYLISITRQIGVKGYTGVPSLIRTSFLYSYIKGYRLDDKSTKELADNVIADPSLNYLDTRLLPILIEHHYKRYNSSKLMGDSPNLPPESILGTGFMDIVESDEVECLSMSNVDIHRCMIMISDRSINDSTLSFVSNVNRLISHDDGEGFYEFIWLLTHTCILMRVSNTRYTYRLIKKGKLALNPDEIIGRLIRDLDSNYSNRIKIKYHKYRERK